MSCLDEKAIYKAERVMNILTFHSLKYNDDCYWVFALAVYEAEQAPPLSRPVALAII
jgi:predicted alpha-1,6-mannanase (GH76 family)